MEEVIIIASLLLMGAFMGSGITLFVQGRRSHTNESQRRLEEQVLRRLEAVLGQITDRIEQLDERVEFSERLLMDQSGKED